MWAREQRRVNRKHQSIMYSRQPLDIASIATLDQVNPSIVLKAQEFYLPSQYHLSAKGRTDAIVLAVDIGKVYTLAVVASIIEHLWDPSRPSC